jgi:hypothetical protein
MDLGTTEITSLALLCFLSMGYSPLSRDETDGRCFGKIVQAGLDWLLSRSSQRKEGVHIDARAVKPTGRPAGRRASGAALAGSAMRLGCPGGGPRAGAWETGWDECACGICPSAMECQAIRSSPEFVKNLTLVKSRVLTFRARAL